MGALSLFDRLTDSPTDRLFYCVRVAPALLSLLAACAIENRTPVPAPPPPPSTANVAKLIVPDESEIPEGREGASIRRGRAIVSAVRDSLPAYTRSGLNCTSCHLDNGTRPWSAPWVGVYGRFPQYRTRNDRINILEDRINDCFERSLNGRALPAGGPGHPRHRGLHGLALAQGSGRCQHGRAGIRPARGVPADTARGEAVFTGECSRCHGSEGGGTALAPPLWGENSFNIGAGMGRLRTAAAFIKFNMPYDNPGSLSIQQAFDVAAYITSRPRPDFAGKENDWPNGDHPPDVPYVTRAARDKANTGRTSQ